MGSNTYERTYCTPYVRSTYRQVQAYTTEGILYVLYGSSYVQKVRKVRKMYKISKRAEGTHTLLRTVRTYVLVRLEKDT